MGGEASLFQAKKRAGEKKIACKRILQLWFMFMNELKHWPLDRLEADEDNPVFL